MNAKNEPSWEEQALESITKLQDPIHGILLSWQDWWLANNALGAAAKWDPNNNPAHLVRSEVNDLNKAMTKIRMLENKLKGDNWQGKTSYDWNLLNSLKREVGIPVEFPQDAKKLDGQGSVPPKALSAFM